MNPQAYFEEVGAFPKGHGIMLSYASGFLFSIALIAFGYYATLQDLFGQSLLIAILAIGALFQFVAQLYFFFHLSTRNASRDRLIALCAFCLISTILISGSVWIMFNLNARMMPDSTAAYQYMQSQSGL